MIIKSKVRGNGGALANYLLNDPKNDRAELLEMRGWTAATLKNALLMSEEIAFGKTQCKNPFYHVSFRLAPGEELTPEQWQHCADTLEKRLGLEEHHRAVVMHTYKGEKHLHVVWDRIDENTLKAVNLFQDRPKCKEVARELEREFGLQQVRDEKREPEKELAAPSMAEEQQARRKGQNLQELRAAIREAWEKSADGKSFTEALDERGFILAQGDKRDYVALDEQGSVFSIGKRTTGATAQQVRAKLADLDRATVPSVEQAREELPARKAERERRKEELGDYEAAQAEREAWEEKIALAAIQKAEEDQKKEQEAKRDEAKNAELGKTAADIRLSVDLSNGSEGFRLALGYRGYTLAQVSEQEAAASFRAATYAKAIGQRAPEYRAGEIVVINKYGGIHRLSERNTGKTRADMDKYLAEIKQEELPTVTQARDTIEQERQERAAKADQDKNAELGKTAADIRLAVQLSKADELAPALKERCLVLSQVSEQEAAAFERAAAEAEKSDRPAPRYTVGELVILNEYGGIHRLTARTTGKTRADMEKYLAGIQREGLPNAEQGKTAAVLLGQYKYRAELLAKQEQQKAELEKQQTERREQREKEAREFEEKAKQEIDASLASKQQFDKNRLNRRLEENHVPLFGRLKARVKQFIGHKIEDHQAEQRKEKLHKAIVENDWRNLSRDEARQARQDKAFERGQATVEIKQAAAREKLGIHAPERDEALKAAQRTATKAEFSKEAAKATRPRETGWPDQRKVRAADRERERPKAPERAAPTGNREGGKFRVIDKATGVATGLSNGAAAILDGIAKPVEAFAEGLASLFDGGSAAPPPRKREPEPTPAQIRAAERALSNIHQSFQRGEDINITDLRNLPPAHLEGLRNSGDEYLQRLMQRWERERENERER